MHSAASLFVRGADPSRSVVSFSTLVQITANTVSVWPAFRLLLWQLQRSLPPRIATRAAHWRCWADSTWLPTPPNLKPPLSFSPCVSITPMLSPRSGLPFTIETRSLRRKINVFHELLCSSQCEAFTKIYGSRLQKVLGQRMEGTHACEVKTGSSKEPPCGHSCTALQGQRREVAQSWRCWETSQWHIKCSKTARKTALDSIFRDSLLKSFSLYLTTRCQRKKERLLSSMSVILQLQPPASRGCQTL